MYPGISIDAFIGLLVLGTAVVGAFVTLQVVLRTHLSDCASYRKMQHESLKELELSLKVIEAQLNRLVGRLEVEQDRERKE